MSYDNPFENIPTDDDIKEAMESIMMMTKKSELTEMLIDILPEVSNDSRKPLENICRNMISYTVSVYSSIAVLKEIARREKIDIDGLIKAIEIQKQCMNGVLGILGIETITKEK